jgi:hypothetical protein
MINFGMQGPNVVNRHSTDEDIACLFGDLSGKIDIVQRMDADCLDWAEVAVLCGFFPSKGQARKNGWEGPVPRGFGQRKFGKQGRGVWFFNPED